MSKTQLENIKYRILKMISSGIITNEDIKELNSMTWEDVSNAYNPNSFKSTVLFQIYCNPYLLCNDNIVKFKFDIDIDDIADLLIKRYNNELEEYTYRLKEGYINRDEYELMCDELYSLYFNSSFVSERLYRIRKKFVLKMFEK